MKGKTLLDVFVAFQLNVGFDTEVIYSFLTVNWQLSKQGQESELISFFFFFIVWVCKQASAEDGLAAYFLPIKVKFGNLCFWPKGPRV